ncbi:MAG: ribonuclease H-like domain-containing protein [Clostridiales bacterium]|nr:ribonuclease H-like domain-containing protein [Candidatus Crickella equi]
MNHINSPVFGEYYSGLKSCVLDIEATGLDPSRCKVILMGLLTETEDGVRVTQFLAENHYEEYKVLQATLDFLRDEGIDYLITFNGLRYDIPFINTRLEANFMDADPDSGQSGIKLYDFDLYRFLRKCSALPRTLGSLSQASCEQHFGIANNRQDTITGRESVALFDEYSISGNSTVEKIILTHNREDVLQLYQLMQLASRNEYADVLDGDFHSAIAKYGFPVGASEGSSKNSIAYSARPVLNEKKKLLTITGDQLATPISAAYFPDIDNPITATFNKTTASYEIQLPVDCHGSDFFVDIKKLGLDINDDPDLINGYLILNSRTINLISRNILCQVHQR